MGKRKRNVPDPFGINKTVKAIRLQTNVVKGNMKEQTTGVAWEMRGYDVKKIHKGADFVAQKRDLLTGNKVGKPVYIESKSGNSRLSKAQKRMKKKMEKDI